jgi:hypothetical protein
MTATSCPSRFRPSRHCLLHGRDGRAELGLEQRRGHALSAQQVHGRHGRRDRQRNAGPALGLQRHRRSGVALETTEPPCQPAARSLPGCRWRRDAAPDFGPRRRCGSGLASALRGRRCPEIEGPLPKESVQVIDRHNDWLAARLALCSMGRTPGRDEKYDRQPLWLLDVSHNLRPRRRRLDPSRAGRARRRRNLLERDPAAEAGTNFRLPHRSGRGAGTCDARRRQRFQRSRAHTSMAAARSPSATV